MESALRDRRLLRRIGRLFRPYRGELWVIAGLIVVTSGLGVVSPLLLKVVFDRALFVRGGPRLGLLYVLLALMVAATVVGALVGIWQSYLTTAVGQRVLRDLRTHLYTHLQTLSLRFFTATRTGDIQSRLANDVGGLQSVITDTASTILSNTVTLISTVIAIPGPGSGAGQPLSDPDASHGGQVRLRSDSGRRSSFTPTPSSSRGAMRSRSPRPMAARSKPA